MTTANFIPSAERSPSTATSLPRNRSVRPRPESERESRLWYDREHARHPVSFGNRRQAGRLRISPFSLQPYASGLVQGIESCHLYQHGRGGWKLAIHKLKTAQRSQERCTPAVGSLSAFPWSNPEYRKEACQVVINRGVSRWAQNRDPFDHGSTVSFSEGYAGGETAFRETRMTSKIPVFTEPLDWNPHC